MILKLEGFGRSSILRRTLKSGNLVLLARPAVGMASAAKSRGSQLLHRAVFSSASGRIYSAFKVTLVQFKFRPMIFLTGDAKCHLPLAVLVLPFIIVPVESDSES